MRIALTGSTGRIGRAIHVHLTRHGHAVRGLDRAPSSTADIVAELDDPAAIDRLLDGAEALVHTAALHAPHVGRVPEAEFKRINVQATARLIDAALARGLRRIVLTSTTALYGHAATPPGRAGWVTEDLTPEPRTIYHRSKLAAEALLRDAAARTPGLQATALRMSRCFPEPADAMAVYRLHRGVDARDVASAHAWALQRSDAGGWRCFIVSGATPFHPEDAEALARDAPAVIRQRAPVLAAACSARGWPLPAGIDRVYVPDALIAEGWRPRHGVEAVLRAWDDESSEVLPPASSAP